MANSDRLTSFIKIYYFQIACWMVRRMKIYLDVIWLLNFLIDILLIFLTAIVLKRRIKKSRLVMGAFLASIYLFFLFSPIEQLAMNPIVKSLYSFLIVLISFGFVRFRLFFQAWLTFYFVNFAVGGGLLGLHYFIQADMSFIQGIFATRTSGFGSPISWLFVLIGFPAIYFFSKQRFESMEATKIRYDQIYPITVIINDLQLQLTGFVDSGNQVEDPLTRRPVMFIDMTEVAEQFPQSIIQFTKDSSFTEANVPKDLEGKITMVPYRTVSDDHQFMWAIRPNKVYVYENGQRFDCSHVLVALSYTSLSDRKDYNSLLHPKMMQKKKLTS